MQRKLNVLAGSSALVVLLAGAVPSASAQQVIFPQKEQPGAARSGVDGDVYTLSNDLFTASFKKQGGSLVFGGCEAMNLKAGSELFRITLGDGTEAGSSEMTVQDVRTTTLAADPQAAKGALRFPGQAIEAEFKWKNLTIKWRAVLRDGSHYLRTEMEITASANQSMRNIRPMAYIVDNVKAKSAPAVVGNTRGAILASDKIFAGVETPMGVNATETPGEGIENFTPLAWTDKSFVWNPGSATPKEILELKTQSNNQALTAADIAAARGAIYFREAGEHTITFNYASGNHRLNIVGVDIADGLGNVKAGDYHVGYTGGNHSANTYKINVPQAGAYLLRYFVETKTETVESSGTIEFSHDFSIPVVVYDLTDSQADTASSATEVPAASLTPAFKATSTASSDYRKVVDRTRWTVTADGWQFDNAAGQPSAMIDGNTGTYWHSWYPEGSNPAGNSKKEMPHWFLVDMKSQKKVTAVAFTTRQDASDKNGHIKNYEIYCGNDASNLTKVKEGVLSYTLAENWVDLPQVTECRYIKVNITSSINGAAFAALAEFRVAEPMETEGGTLAFERYGSYTTTWKPATWTQMKKEEVPTRVGELGHYYPDIYKKEVQVSFPASGSPLTAEFLYANGNNRLQIVGLDLVQNGNVVASDYHFGFTGNNKENNVYSVTPPNAGSFTLRYLVSMKDEKNTSSGNITLSYATSDTLHVLAPNDVPIYGDWVRNTTLEGGKTWTVSSVVGLIAKGQARRSVLAYSERERAVAWRPYPVYISWYELNIDRNNDANYTTNMNVGQCTNIVKNWKTAFYDKYGKAPMAFVWDDGWDVYGRWDKFNKNFPNGFKEPADEAAKMGAGIGAWLGPVGGYGQSGNYRRAYWNADGRGGMQLSNPAYRKVFMDGCMNMINSYDFRFFKYDGISAQFSAVGPDLIGNGLENAEAIIQIEKDIREKKPDIFLNTTVGTWASPFWFQFTDAVWRQEQDYGEIGNQGTDREKWITYRDRLVYQNFVQNSPLCPINTLMTHGFILTKFGNVSKNMDYDGIVRELRCAFACGSGMVELYNDYSLMNDIANSKGEKGMLWAELAKCMDWQQANADVLPDIHWVGGNPWDGAKANIYGWAAWNGKKAVLTLRNPAASSQTITTTLRKALDIPEFIKTSVTLTNAFDDQAALQGLETGKEIDIDAELTITMPASSVFVFNGVDRNPVLSIPGIAAGNAYDDVTDNRVYDLSGRTRNGIGEGFNIVGGKKVFVTSNK